MRFRTNRERDKDRTKGRSGVGERQNKKWKDMM